MRTAAILLVLFSAALTVRAQERELKRDTFHFFGVIGSDAFTIRISFSEERVRVGRICDSTWYSVDGEYQVSADTTLPRFHGQLAVCKPHGQPLGYTGRPFTVALERVPRQTPDSLRLMVTHRDVHWFLTGRIFSSDTAISDTIWGMPFGQEEYARSHGWCDSALRREAQRLSTGDTCLPANPVGALGFWIGMNTRQIEQVARDAGLHVIRSCRNYYWNGRQYPFQRSRVTSIPLAVAAGEAFSVESLGLVLSEVRQVSRIELTSFPERADLETSANRARDFLIARYGVPTATVGTLEQAIALADKTGDATLYEWLFGDRVVRLRVGASHGRWIPLLLSWE